MRQLREARNYDSLNGKWLYIGFLIIVLAFGGVWLSSHSTNLSISGYATSAPAAGPLERVLIVPSNAALGADAKALLSDKIEHEFSDGSFTAEIASSSKTELKRFGEVKTVPQLHISQPQNEGTTCTPSAQKPWGVAKLGGGSGGAGINIAILDTGVAKHSDLSIAVCKDATKKRLSDGCNDQNGHGTHVAGIATANGGSDGKGIFGVAPNAGLWTIKVCKADGTCYADDVAEGIYYAVNNGANIISMSFGADSDVPLIRAAIDYGVQHGVLFVAAAGDGSSIDWPAANFKVIAVGALDSSNTIPSWSSSGINALTIPYSVEERDIEFVAPGVGIESTWNDGCYRTLSSTSMAAPHIAGLAAKLWQGSAAATRDYLQYIARYNYADIGGTGDDNAAGFGLPVAA
jgi:subtilisin